MNFCSPIEEKFWSLTAQLLVEGVPPVFRLDALRERRWACVAIEDELEGDAAEQLACACARHGLVAGWSVEIPWKPGIWTPAAHSFALSAADIQALSKNAYLGSCFVLAENEGCFAITSDGDLYWMLAGPQAFVETVLGVSIEAQLQVFNKNVGLYAGAGSLAGQRLAIAQAVAIAACAAI